MRTLAKVTAMSLLATLARAFTTAAPRRARLRALRAEDTIYALSSGRGVAGVAVVRVSGPLATPALERLTGKKPPEVRKASLRSLRAPATGELLDEALVLRFEAPKSFTGEDVVELHCHGGRATVDGVLEALDGVEGLRAALDKIGAREKVISMSIGIGSTLRPAGRRMCVALAMVAVAAFMELQTCATWAQSPEPNSSDEASLPVVTAIASTRDVPTYLTSIGTVVASKTTVVRSGIEGELTEIDFTAGQRVQAGDLLARVNAVDDPAHVQVFKAPFLVDGLQSPFSAHEVHFVTSAMKDVATALKENASINTVP